MSKNDLCIDFGHVSLLIEFQISQLQPVLSLTTALASGQSIQGKVNKWECVRLTYLKVEPSVSLINFFETRDVCSVLWISYASVDMKHKQCLCL